MGAEQGDLHVALACSQHHSRAAAGDRRLGGLVWALTEADVATGARGSGKHCEDWLVFLLFVLL